MSTPGNHAINVLAVAAAPVSFWIHAAPVVTTIAGGCGIVWYGVLFYKELKVWYKAWKRRHGNHGPQ